MVPSSVQTAKLQKFPYSPPTIYVSIFLNHPPCVRPWQGGAVCGLMCWRRDLVACVGRLFWILPESEYLCVMKTNRIFVAFSLFVAFMSAGVPASAQSLFDEMLIDGETVSTDTVVAATQAASASQSQASPPCVEKPQCRAVVMGSDRCGRQPVGS